MARIPGSDGFGEVIARPQRFNESQTPRVGARAAETLVAVGTDIRRAEIEEERQAAAAREAAERAQAQTARTVAADELVAISDEVGEGVRSGAIDKASAGETWAERARERVSAALEGVPGAYRDVVQRDLDHRVNMLGRGVRKAVTQRDQADVRSGIDQTLEYAGRLYQTDPAAADTLAQQTLEGLGPASGLDPAQLQKVGQAWREQSRFTRAYGLVNGARRDNKALEAVSTQLGGDEFADIDPQRKSQLFTQIEGFKVANVQRAEADARRRQAEQERALRLAESQFTAAQSIITTGKTLSPEYVEQVSRAVAGTPYELAFRESLKEAPARAAFGMQPLAVQRDALSLARAQLNASGTSPDTEKRYAEMERIHRQAVKDYEEDPLLAAQERGVLPAVAPLNLQAGIAGIVDTLAERVAQAQMVQQQVGQPVSPLLKAEAEQVGKTLNLLPVDQRSSALAQLAQALGPEQSAALARQMAPKDKALGIALGMAGLKTTRGRYGSELVLRGAQAIKDRAVKEDNAVMTGIRARVAAEIGEAYPNEELRQAMIDAAVLIDYGFQSEDGSDIPRAVRFATGGITERNGRKLPLPRGLSASDFEKRLATMPVEAVAGQLPDGKVYLAGVPMDVATFTRALPQAVLLHAGPGRYAVQTGASMATNAQGRPVIIEVR